MAGAVVEVAVEVAATSVEWVECHMAALTAECHVVASLVAAWARAARAGAAAIGMATTAMAEIGMATTGTVTTGIMGIITAMM